MYEEEEKKMIQQNAHVRRNSLSYVFSNNILLCPQRVAPSTGGERKAEGEAEAGTTTEAEAGIATKARAETKLRLRAEAETGAKAEVETGAEAEAKTEVGARPEARDNAGA